MQADTACSVKLPPPPAHVQTGRVLCRELIGKGVFAFGGVDVSK